MRKACGLFDYTDPKGKKCVRLANVVDKFGVEGGLEAFILEAAKHGITIPVEHLDKEVKQRGRPKSSSPRARSASKIATSDTGSGSGSGSEPENDDEEYQAKKQQRKKVTKTAAAASSDSDAAPKKRGRPAKAKEAAPEPKDDLIQDLVASAKKAATPKTVTPAAAAKSSAPASPELSEDEVSSPVAVVAKPAAKISSKPKAAAKPKSKAPERVQVECDGEKFWIEKYNSEEILVRCSDNIVFCSRDGVGYNIGTWDEKTKTVIEDEEESSDEE